MSLGFLQSKEFIEGLIEATGDLQDPAVKMPCGCTVVGEGLDIEVRIKNKFPTGNLNDIYVAQMKSHIKNMVKIEMGKLFFGTPY